MSHIWSKEYDDKVRQRIAELELQKQVLEEQNKKLLNRLRPFAILWEQDSGALVSIGHAFKYAKEAIDEYGK